MKKELLALIPWFLLVLIIGYDTSDNKKIYIIKILFGIIIAIIILGFMFL